MNEHARKVLAVFVDVLSVPPDIETRSLVYNQSERWDSIGHMSLVAGLEEAFDCMLETEDILDMSSFDEAVRIMEKHVHADAP